MHPWLATGFPDSLQATSLLTPIMATLAGEKPSKGVWLGCCCTLAGTVLITLDHSALAADHGGPAAASSLGNLLLACVSKPNTLILAYALLYQLLTPS